MALDARKLAPLGGQNGEMRLWLYGPTTDTISSIAGGTYFDSIGGKFRTGDMMLVRSTAASGGGSELYDVAVSGTDVTLTASAVSA